MNKLAELIRTEGDKKEWVYTCKNGIEFNCLIRRNPAGGHLCGYVILTPDSDFFEKEYDNIPVNCHGRLTYGSGEGDKWVIGFDCAHIGDLRPYYTDGNLFGETAVYRDMDFVTEECESICEQISEKSISHKRKVLLDNIISQKNS